jgi:glycosyltransferase involved in cell wall biosynthesis
MKFCAAMMMMNESDWLKLCLPVLSKADIQGIVILDGGSTDDSVAVAESLGATVYHRAWDWKPLDQENYLIECCEQAGYDAMLLTAPDELWMPSAIDDMKAVLGQHPSAILQFPTINFVRDRLHYAPHAPYFPDFHQRAWVLGRGIRHAGVLDSVPMVDRDDIMLLPHLLYHYVHLKDRRYYHYKHQCFHRVKDGLPPLDIPWQEVDPVPYPPHIPFTGSQPIDPYTIGVRAPLEQE